MGARTGYKNTMHQREYTPHSFDGKAPLFRIRDLGYRYGDGRRALEDINLDIYPGDRIALAGHNGAGKTTFVKHLNGIYRPEKGSILYKGEPLDGEERLQRARLEIGVLFQDPDDQLFCNTLYEDIVFGPLNQGLSRQKADQLARHTAQSVGLGDFLYKAPHRLSYGQKKRAALATVLSMDPQVLILDEPTANLDSKQENLLWDLIQDFAGTLIVISHDLAFLFGLCQRAVVFEEGRIHHDFTMSELVSQPALMRSHGLDFNFRFHCCQNGNSEDHAHDHYHHHHDDHHHGPGPVPHDRLPDHGRDPAAVSVPPHAHEGGNLNGHLIDIEHYSFRYPDGSWGLREVSLQVHRGESLAIVGENGAGKSTLAHCLVGVLSGTGTLLFDGKPARNTAKSGLWRKIGIVFQNPSDQLFCPTCEEEVAFGPRQMGLGKSEVRERVLHALELVRLSGYEKRVPLHMSAGERKRLAIAAALSMTPEVLILDEPTASLDPQNEELLVRILSGLPMTKLLISHDILLIRALCTRVIVLHSGRKVRDYGLEDFVEDHHLISLNGLDYTYRNACHERIMALQHADPGK